MIEPTSTARIVMTTVASAEDAARLGRTLVEERLAACATVLPSAHSVYRWQGKIDSSDETLLLLKTATDQLSALESRLQELHSYETPEFLVIEIEAGSRSYLKWLSEYLGAPRGTKV
jgi:periplasmic divalent cation tolerance protein